MYPRGMPFCRVPPAAAGEGEGAGAVPSPQPPPRAHRQPGGGGGGGERGSEGGTPREAEGAREQVAAAGVAGAREGERRKVPAGRLSPGIPAEPGPGPGPPPALSTQRGAAPCAAGQPRGGTEGLQPAGVLGVRAAARCSGAGAAPGPSCPLARAGVPRFGCPSLSFPAERAGKGSKGGLAASWLGLARGARGEARTAGGARGPGGAQPGEQRKEINQSQDPPSALHPRPPAGKRRHRRKGPGPAWGRGDVRRRVLSW